MTTKDSDGYQSDLVKEVHALQHHIHPPGTMNSVRQLLCALDSDSHSRFALLFPTVPNPAPLGLIGFGLTTALLQVKHTRLSGESDDDLDGVDTVVLGFAMFFGGLLQVSEIDRRRFHVSYGNAHTYPSRNS